MTDEEILHVQRLLEVTRKRRDALEVQAATYGRARVPAEISVELDEANESIARLNAKLRIVTVPTIIQKATGPEASLDVLRYKVEQLTDQVGTMWRYLEHMILEDRGITEAWRDKQKIERSKGVWERRIVEIVLGLGVIVAIILAVVAFRY